jgi:aromatic-L-amino-acid decarboxylase
MSTIRPDERSVSSFISEKSSAKVLSTQTAGYQQAFYLRRSVSTMADVARSRLVSLALEAAAVASAQRRPVRILSIGCGDGDLDFAVLHHLSGSCDVEYLGLEVNETSAQIFQESVDGWRDQFVGNLSFEIRFGSAERLPDAGSGFDLVLMSHVLYYFQDPVSLIWNYLQKICRIDGKVVIVHSAWGGIPELMADVPGLQPFLFAENIRDSLASVGLRVQCEILASELDATEILDQTIRGRQILGFCIERDVDRLPDETWKRLLKSLWSRCEIRDDRAWLSEPLAFLTLRNDLGFFSIEPKTPIDAACDPIEDYHQLARAFDWPARLLPRAGEPCKVLDVGCGTGRWLKVLRHHWPELAGRYDAIRYSAIDPSAEAKDLARARVQGWAQWDRDWTQKIQCIADLPTAHYDIAWSMHALYAVSRVDLEVVLTKIVGALRDDGVAVIAMPNRESFYITAGIRLANQPSFTCAEDIVEALQALQFSYEVRELDYEERIAAADEMTVRRYVWEESIGNSYSAATNESGALPPLPNDPWFESLRRDDAYCFPQKVRVFTIRGGQSPATPRAKLTPAPEQLREWALAATDAGLAEQGGLPGAPVIENIAGALPPEWVHGAGKADVNERAALNVFASVIDEPLPEWASKDLDALLQEDFLPLIRHGTRDNAPGYMGYIPSGGLYLGAIADYLATSFNRYSAMFMASPGAAAIEALSIRWLNEITGLQASAEQSGVQAGGVLVSGASLATVTAVHAARQKAVRQGKNPDSLVAYFGRTAHCCVPQALSVCGIQHHRVIPVLADHRMDMDQLAKTIAQDREAGLEPFFISLSAGEVEIGAIDDIERGRALASDASAWLHVDGAYGAFFVLARSAPSDLRKISLADSLCVDPHKGLGLPYGTGALLVRNAEDLRCAFANEGNYLPTQSESVRPPDAMDLGIEMTRPFRGLRLWLPIKLLGIAPFRDHLEQMLQLARWLAEEIRAIPQLELVSQPGLSICTFRLKPPASEQANRRLLSEINADGWFFLTGCTLSTGEGGFALRVALLSIRTDEQTVHALLGRIRESVRRVCSG